MAISGIGRNVRIRFVVGLALVGLFWWQVRSPRMPADAVGGSNSGSVLPPAVAYSEPAPLKPTSYAELVQTDPLALLRTALERYEDSVSDYTCLFTKQERINGRLGPEQQIRVRFRETPFSVLMEWVKNPGKARRVLYVEGRWEDAEGHKLAKVEPQGAIARMLVRSVARPIDGPDARAASRKTIDHFGFANVLRLIIKYAELAVDTGQGSLVYLGEGQIDGRATWILRRTLPYTHEGGPWPDCVLLVHIDQERLLPVACYAYADDDQQVLLGKYIFTDVQLNVGLSEADFDPQATGF